MNAKIIGPTLSSVEQLAGLSEKAKEATGVVASGSGDGGAGDSLGQHGWATGAGAADGGTATD